MANYNIQIALALESLRSPLNPLPLTDEEDFINSIRSNYRSYLVECNVNRGAVMLPTMFADDFRDEICRVALLVDSKENQFECLVEKINGNVYLTRGWGAIHNFYDIPFGAWLVLLYVGGGQFGLILHDRFHQHIDPPPFVPPIKFLIDMQNVPPYFVDGLQETLESLSYSHDDDFFLLSHQKDLTYYDISTGFMMLPHDGFGEFAFAQDMTSIKLVDDCGNRWNCTLVYVTFPVKHFKIGGEWNRFMAARRLSVGERITVGAHANGHSEAIYLKFGP